VEAFAVLPLGRIRLFLYEKRQRQLELDRS